MGSLHPGADRAVPTVDNSRHGVSVCLSGRQRLEEDMSRKSFVCKVDCCVLKLAASS